MHEIYFKIEFDAVPQFLTQHLQKDFTSIFLAQFLSYSLANMHLMEYLMWIFFICVAPYFKNDLC